jgi:hypothetical protein
VICINETEEMPEIRFKTKKHINNDVLFVAPKGIEPLPKVPETFILSIKLQSPYLRMAKVNI